LNCPFILSSFHRNIRQDILDEGVLGFVGKPYRRAERSQRVAEALKQDVQR
jgi:hypothetical protein